MESHPHLTRRTFLGAGAVAVGAAATGVRPTSASAALVRVRPRAADALVNSFGVGIHLNHRKSPYGRHADVVDWLTRLGVRHVRTRLSVGRDVLDAFADLSRAGIKVQGVCGALGEDQTMSELMTTVRRRYRNPSRIFTAFEGINEPNNDGIPWVEETRAKTHALHEARAAQGLTGIPIVAPALARVNSGGVEGDDTWEQAGSLGDLSGLVDIGNMHVYSRGLPPSSDLARFRDSARRVAGSQPVMCTEGGYFTAMGYTGGAYPVPEKVAAVYGPQAILQHWIFGTRRFFRYELLDEPYPSSTDREGTFGMVRTGGDWSAKPDFAPTRRLLQTFSDRGPRFTPRPIDMALTDGPRKLRKAVFAKRDGTHLLALWIDRPIYDPVARKMLVRSLTAPMASVRLSLGSRRDLKVQHLTTLGTSETFRNTRSARIDLTPGVTLVKIS